mmetsp:Transcript_7943/g.15946  ORF Transcript_7943/g.15946 Transcript_7943/m.15946 type:complete len:217 (-) Transcript_7943:38-688(-)
MAASLPSSFICLTCSDSSRSLRGPLPRMCLKLSSAARYAVQHSKNLLRYVSDSAHCLANSFTVRRPARKRDSATATSSLSDSITYAFPKICLKTESTTTSFSSAELSRNFLGGYEMTSMVIPFTALVVIICTPTFLHRRETQASSISSFPPILHPANLMPPLLNKAPPLISPQNAIIPPNQLKTNNQKLPPTSPLKLLPLLPSPHVFDLVWSSSLE